MCSDAEIKAHARRDVSAAPSIVGRGQAQIPRIVREIAALGGGGCGHRVAIVATALSIDLCIERERGALAEIERDRREEGEAPLAVVEPVVEPLARRDRAVANGL